MKGNLLVAQAGGPTCALNATLKGVIEEALPQKEMGEIYGALGGAGGIIDERMVDLGRQPKQFIVRLQGTPGAVLGTSRRPLSEEDFQVMVKVLRKRNIKYLCFNGGNGSMITCLRLHQMLEGEISVVGIPKTIDNDIAVTDHSPGFPSAARYMAVTTAEISRDVAAMPIHVSIVEAMGRNVGWIAAASVLARSRSQGGPQLVYLPERPFSEAQFLEKIAEKFHRQGGFIVVVSEGLVDEQGKPVAPQLVIPGHKDPYPGDVSVYLANKVWTKLGIKARAEKPGIALRSSATLHSEIDILEAMAVGARAVRAAVSGDAGTMVGIRRVSSEPYRFETMLIPLSEVAGIERCLPDLYINATGDYITDAYIDYCLPLVGKMPLYAELDQSLQDPAL